MARESPRTSEILPNIPEATMFPEAEVPWSSYLTMPPSVRTRIKGYEAVAERRHGESRPVGCLVNINQNPEHMPTVGPICPALLCGSRLWAMSLSREVVAQENLELQGYIIFDAHDEFGVPEGMRRLFLTMSQACVRRLAGNAMHLACVGTAHAFLLIMMEPVCKTIL